MNRKIIAQKDSFTITLPKKWAKDMGIKAGDEIEVKEINNSLILETEPTSSKKEITIRLVKNIHMESIIRTQIQTPYRAGYDKLIVYFNDKKQAHIVENIIKNRMLGFEIVKKNKDNYFIESITEPSNEKQEIIHRRIFFIIIESLNIISEDLQNKKFKNLRDIERKTSRINKYANFLYRNITNKKFNDPLAPIYWTHIDNLVIIQHIIWHLYEALNEERDKKFSEDLLHFFEQIKSEFEQVHTYFYKKDLVEVIKSTNKLKVLKYKKLLPELKECQKNERIILFHFGELSWMIYMLVFTMNAIILE